MVENRVRLNKGQQKLFIKYVMQKLDCYSLKALLDYNLNVTYSTLKKYYQERYSMPIFFAKRLCSLAGVNLNTLNFTLLNKNWGAIKGGKKGIMSMRTRHKNKLKMWRAKGGRNSGIHFNNLKKIRCPKLNEDLAEFIGVYLGDGTMTNYFIRISGDYRYDKPYFNYLSKLIFNLFGIKPSIVKDKRPINTFYLTLLSKNVCSFLRDKYNINYGNKIKNRTGIPHKILENKKLSIACLRGLVDTDGSVSRRGRGGSQFCVQFTSHNPKLLKQVNYVGQKLKIFTYLTGDETGTNKWENILRYFRIVGSSNLRHIVRFSLKYRQDKTTYLKEVPAYYKKGLYRNIYLPFKMDQWSSG